MSLIEDLKAWYKDESYPPDGPELDVDQDTSTDQVAYERNGALRWGESIRVIYQRGDEFVAVEDVAPATEMQDWGDYGEPEIYKVQAVEKTITVIEYNRT